MGATCIYCFSKHLRDRRDAEMYAILADQCIHLVDEEILREKRTRALREGQERAWRGHQLYQERAWYSQKSKQERRFLKKIFPDIEEFESCSKEEEISRSRTSNTTASPRPRSRTT